MRPTIDQVSRAKKLWKDQCTGMEVKRKNRTRACHLEFCRAKNDILQEPTCSCSLAPLKKSTPWHKSFYIRDTILYSCAKWGTWDRRGFTCLLMGGTASQETSHRLWVLRTFFSTERCFKTYWDERMLSSITLQFQCTQLSTWLFNDTKYCPLPQKC